MSAGKRRDTKGGAADTEHHPSPVGRSHVPFHAPSQDVGTGITGSNIMQPVMELRETATQEWAPPINFSGRITAQVSALSEVIKPVGVNEMPVELPKYMGTSVMAKERLAATGLTQTGTQQTGFSLEQRHVDLPEHADFTGQRAKQTLGQLGEIMMHQAGKAGLNPTEIQFGYGVSESGSLDLFASANKPEVQDWLHGAMMKPIGEHLESAAMTGDPATQRMAAKLLWHSEQTATRRMQLGEGATEHTEKDFNVADSIVHKFLSRDLTVVKNPGGRHAEQNVAAAIHISHEKKGYQLADVQGSKVRCSSCSSELGHELASGPNLISGKVLPTHASVPRQEHGLSLSPKYAKSPSRPRSNTLPGIPIVKK